MKIAFVSDVRGWAFDVTYKGIAKYLEADLYYTSDEPRINRSIIEQYDAVHFFNWLGAQEFAGMPNVSAGVCQWNHRIKWGDIAPKYIRKFPKVVAISRELEHDLQKLNDNVTYIPNAVDDDLFQPSEYKGKFTVGWASQKTSGGFGEEKTGEGRKRWDIKGYQLLLEPIIARLKDEMDFKICSNDYTTAIPHEEMPAWYTNINCLLCTSLYEGGPFSVLEAAASGKAIVSTKVGIVPEMVRDYEGGFLVDAPRNRQELPAIINQLVEHLKYLKENPELCNTMGFINRQEILSKWTWKIVAPMWKKFFEEN